MSDEQDQDKTQQAEQEAAKYTQSQFDEETKGLKANRDQIKQEKLDLQKQLDAYASAKEAGERDKMLEKEDFKGLLTRAEAESQSWKSQFEELKTSQISKELGGNAFAMAASISLSEAYNELLADQFKKYIVHTDKGLAYEVDGVEVSKDAVIGLISNKYPDIVRGNGIRGGGANGGGNNGNGVVNVRKFADMNGEELIALRKSDPAAYQKAKDLHNNPK